MIDGPALPPGPGLAVLGWDRGLARSLEALRLPGAAPARITRLDRGGWVTVEGAVDGRARLHPRFRRVADAADAPAVGDWAAVVEAGGTAVLEALVPRRSALTRDVGGDGRPTGQVLAANVDVAFVTLPADGDRTAGRTDRFLSVAAAGGARPVLLLTRADACADPVGAVREVRAQAPGVDVHAVSVRTGEGVAQVEEYLGPGTTAALLGVSGAGKSTLANHLAGRDAQATGAVRPDGTGRHTTSWRQLVRLPRGGLLIDTPGLRAVGLWEEADDDVFADLRALAEHCRFSDCMHGNEPDCALRAADADRRVASGRLERFLALEQERARVAVRRRTARMRRRT